MIHNDTQYKFIGNTVSFAALTWAVSLCLSLRAGSHFCLSITLHLFMLFMWHLITSLGAHLHIDLHNSHQLTWSAEKGSNSPLKDVTTSWFTLGSWGSVLNHRGNHTSSLHDAAWLQQPAVEKREGEGKEEREWERKRVWGRVGWWVGG